MDLKSLFEPASVAVVGASDNPGKLGFHVMKSLVQGGYAGRILPINPGRGLLWEREAHATLREVSSPVDLVVVAVPAAAVPGVFADCRETGVKGMVLITAGFKEVDAPEGAALQRTLTDTANAMGLPVIGPNTFGMVNLHRDLNASFTPEFSEVRKGGVSLVSQSGGISHLLAFLAMREGVGMSKIIGLGNRMNVDFAEVLPYLMTDPDTRSIALYIEGLDDPGRLLAVARRFRGHKPVVAYKTGSSRVGDLSSRSHTGSLAGNHALYGAALKQAGILWARDAETFLDLARALGTLPPLQGPRIAVLTGQAGPGMAASDVCEAAGLRIEPFGERTQATINRFLPPLALRTNPVDMGPAWYNPEAITGIVDAVLADEDIDGLLLLMMFASANRAVVPFLSEHLAGHRPSKPLALCFLAPPGVWDAEILRLERAGVAVHYPTPERAARAMAGLRRYNVLKTVQ